MKIRSLRLEHFRKFTDPVVLAGLVDGVNVLAEGNEFGKSTLLAAIRGVLFERHVSKAASVVAMQHHTNKTSPVISLEFELPTGLHRIEKRFLHKEPYARLTLPDGTVHHGEAAEEQLQRILNFTQAGKTGSKADNVGMWAALWVTQRDSVDQPNLPDSARQTIHGCLEEEVGALTGGTRGKTLLASVRGELAKIRNGLGKPAGRYKEAVEELDRAKQSVTTLEARQRSLVQDIGALQTAKRKLAEADIAGEEARTDDLLVEARQKRDVAQRFEDQESNATATLRLCEIRLASVTRDTETRKVQQNNLLRAEERVQSLTAEESSALATLRQAEAALNQQKQLLAEATEVCDRAGHTLRTARTIVDLAATSGNLLSLETRLELADQSQARVNDLTARLSSLLLTEKDLTNLRNLDKNLRKTQAVLEAQATHITFDLLPAAADLVQVNGGPVLAGAIPVIHDAVITITGIGTIRIQPGIQDREELLARQSEEARALRNALQILSVAGIEQAEEQCAARQLCERQLEQARIEVTSHTPADPAQKIDAGVEALRNQISVLRTRLEAGMAAAGLEVLPELDAARETLCAEVQYESEASDKVAIARAPLTELEEQHASALRLHAQSESKKNSAVEEQMRITRERDHLILQESAEALAERLSASTDALLAQQSLIDNMQKTRPAETVAGMDARIARYQQAKDAYLADRQQTKQEIAVLESRIEREEGVGIEEQVAAAQRLAESLELACARYVREIKVLELLLQNLETAEQAAKERYMAPIVRRVTPYLQTLFPGAAIHCNEEFQITGIVRELQQTESFTGLSDGTQEQIAVLTRLAFADMLVERGKPAMIILDDALVYSDPERMERMFDLLTHAATRTQILIFTCRGELFTRLGGHRLRLIPGSAL